MEERAGLSRGGWKEGSGSSRDGRKGLGLSRDRRNRVLDRHGVNREAVEGHETTGRATERRDVIVGLPPRDRRLVTESWCLLLSGLPACRC